jgi:hypothetical protein
MKINQPINVQVCSRRIMLRPAKFLEFLHFYEASLPQLKPSVFNWTDPVNKPWNLSHYENYLPPDRFGDADNIYWRKRSAPKATGYFEVGRKRKTGVCDELHSGVSFIVELNRLDIFSVTDYVKSCCVRFDGDIAQIHWVTPQEKPMRRAEIDFDVQGANAGSEFVISSLRHWLPALPWAVVFGDAYVRMFGMERLLSSPAFKVEQLSDSAVYIQLTPNLSDLEADYASFHATRLQVQAHLGSEAFFDPTRAYPLRGPIEDLSMIEYAKALADFRCPPPGTNGFKVPEFQFIEDPL